MEPCLIKVGGIWKNITETFKIKFDYPNIEQKYKLQDIITEGIDFDTELDAETGLIDYKKLTKSQRTKLRRNSNRWSDYNLRYSIKDWQGLPDGEGGFIPCKVINNELDESLWIAILNSELKYDIDIACNEALRWSEMDKKKFISSEDSNLKAD